MNYAFILSTTTFKNLQFLSVLRTGTVTFCFCLYRNRIKCNRKRWGDTLYGNNAASINIKKARLKKKSFRKLLFMVYIRSQNRSRNRNYNLSKVGTGTIINITVPRHWFLSTVSFPRMAGVSVCWVWKLASRCVFLLTPERSGWSRLRPASGEAFRKFSTPHRHIENPGRTGFMMHNTLVPCLAAILKIRDG
jgi:hypothetical protein